ncbi:MAG: hypothetical protein LLG37_10315 [Spirochaetia bacterium]|nr:hypothetical protein [Spirochaetia bacterium]
MGSKFSKLLLISFCMLSLVTSAFGATRFIIIAPGETFTPGTVPGKSGSPSTQVVGIPFGVTVVSVNDAANYNVIETFGSVSMTANAASVITPANNFNLNASYSSTANCMRYPVTVTLNSSGTTVLTATNNPDSGILAGTVTVPSQTLDHFAFGSVATRNAGEPFPVVITAQDGSNATVTGYNGVASVSAVYSGQNLTTSLGTVTFTNGVFSGNLTLFDATEGAQTVTLKASRLSPTASGSSGTFAVNAGAYSQMLIVGPGQTYLPGTGNGRVSQSETTTAQTAGTSFTATLYAVDAYFNTVTSVTGNVNLTSTDGNVTFSPAVPSLASGKATVTVTMRTVGAGTQTFTATYSGGGTADSDIVPVHAAAMDHFGFRQTITSKTAGELFNIYYAALDAYNNTVTTWNTVPTIRPYTGSTPLATYHFYTGSATMANGLGSAEARIYQRVFNATVRLTATSYSGSSNSFDVSAAECTRLLIIAPGQAYEPGDIVDGGVTGSPNYATAGSSIVLNVYATDDYGNKVSSVNDTVSITCTDSAATVNGGALPGTINLSTGQGSFNIIFNTSGLATTMAEDTSNTDIIPASQDINVVAAGLSYFEIANVPTSRVAAQSFVPIIRAKDVFGNTKTDFTGVVFVSANSDYSLPSESTIAITGPKAGASSYKWAVTFTAGDLGESEDLTGYFYRAMTTTPVRLFVSDIFADTPDSNSGHIGYSNWVTVTAGTGTKLQVLVPGMTARPGTSDGENGAPTGQIVAQAFSCTINFVDPWWNIITGTGSSDTINMTTSDPTNSQINGSSTLPRAVYLTAGTANFTATYSQPSTSFNVQATNASRGGITGDSSPNISIFNVGWIDVTATGGGFIGTQVAGTAFQIELKAYEDQYKEIPATSFNGTVNLEASNNYSLSEYCISPTLSVNFVNGVATMNVTMYRSGTNLTVNAILGSVTYQSNSFNVGPAAATSVLIRIDGMVHKPGLKHVGIPGYKGYEGSPKTMEAGAGFQLELIYVDDNYNRVTWTAATTCRITSTDPIASLDGTPLSSTVDVPITNGAYLTSSGMVLRTVGTIGMQRLTAEPAASLPNANSPYINLRHTTFDHFGVHVPTTPVTAGIPFSITIRALDAYQNVCDNRNGGTPFNNAANLSSNTGSNTMWPVTQGLTNGTVTSSVQLFKAPETTANITAEFGGNTGTSDYINTVPNGFERLLVISNGMVRDNGRFTGANPSVGIFYMYDTARPPYYPSYSTTVNDATHSPTGEQFMIYSCDAYGNIAPTPDAMGYTVTVTTNDPYAVPVTQTTIDGTYGNVVTNVIFHTAMSGAWVQADINNPQIENYRTPTFTTKAGTEYGLQLLIPGLYVVNGSGHDVAGVWNNAVQGTPQTQVSGAYFPVTVQAADIYGNFVNVVSDEVRVTSTGPTGSFPTSTNSFRGNIGDADVGILTLSAMMNVSAAQFINLQVDDLDNNTLDQTWENQVNVYVILGGELSYRVYASPDGSVWTPYGDGTNSITAVAYPSKFSFRVETVDSYNNQPVFGASNMFECAPVLANSVNTVLGGTLAIASGQVNNGIFVTNNQSYTGAGRIRIRVTDPNNVLQVRYSPIIDMTANSTNVTFTLTPSHQNVRADTQAVLTGSVFDVNNNPVSGGSITFQLTSGHGQFTNDSTTITVPTDAYGQATAYFVGDFVNEDCVVLGTYSGNGATRTATVSVSMVQPDLGSVSNYPNPFNAGTDTTTISYVLDEDTAVKINIYTLFGDLVYSQDIGMGQPGAITGIVNNVTWNGRNNKGEIVGNGGYICVVEAKVDGQARKMIRKIAVSK